MGNKITIDVAWVDEVGHAEFLAPLTLVAVHVNADEHGRSYQLESLQDIEADTAKIEYDKIRTWYYFCSFHHGAHAGRNSTSDVANFVERCVLAVFRERNFWHNGIIGEIRRTHVVVDGLAFE